MSALDDLSDDLAQHLDRERDEFVGRLEESHWADRCPVCKTGPCYLFFRRGVWMCGTCCWTRRPLSRDTMPTLDEAAKRAAGVRDD